VGNGKEPGSIYLRYPRHAAKRKEILP